MSEEDRKRWDERYATGDYKARTHPTPLLEEWLPELPRGRALDIACGAGRNTLCLARNGYTADGVDISAEALARGAASAEAEGLAVNWVNADLEREPLPDGPYEVIFVARYLERRVIPQILDRLAPGGWLVYEQHVLSDDPDIGGPKSRLFRLRPQELLHLFAELHVVYFREGSIADPDGRRMALSQLVAKAR